MALAETAWTEADFNWYQLAIDLKMYIFWLLIWNRQAATAAGTKLYGTSILITIYNYLDSLDTSKSSIYVIYYTLFFSSQTNL